MGNWKRFFSSLLTSTAWWSGVAVSLVLYLVVARVVEDKNQAQFDLQADNSRLAVQTRVRAYVDLLRGASAVFSSGHPVGRDTFRAYVAQLDLKQSFPGIENLNFAARVSAADKDAFIDAVRSDRSVRAEGHPGFDILPPGERDEYHVLTYLEPMEGNEQAFGLDLGATAAVGNTLAVSRDSGQPASSVRLIRIGGPDNYAGIAIRMPVYRGDMPTGSVAERRAAYYGSVGAGINLNLLMAGAVDQQTWRKMRIRLFNGHAGRPEAGGAGDDHRMLFDSTPSRPAPGAGMHVKRVSMNIGPRVWEAEFSAPRDAFATRFDTWLPWIMLIAGLLGTTLLYCIYYSMRSARGRAVDLAREMTRDLRNSEASLAEAQHMAHLGSWTLEPNTRVMNWSAETGRIFGMSHYRAEQQYDDFLRRVHADDRQFARAGLNRALAGEEEFNAELRICRLDGAVRWVQLIARLGSDERTPLLRGTIMDINDRKETVEALHRSRELLRELTAYQDRVKEEERKRIAREIHDELGQTLLALRIDVSMLEARTARSHPRLHDKVRSALGQIDATVKTIRTIINNLRPAVLDLGLTAAFEWQVNEFRRRSGIGCELRMSGQELEVDDTLATSLFRILQESLTNVIRHANASYVLVDLYQDEGRLVLKITDNGIGLLPGPRKRGNSFGLIGVEERVHALNGEFRISSAPGKGTTLIIQIPLVSPETQAPARLGVGAAQG
ncbi:sensor histidine kinase [Noviherbaspirillum aridicola]|uniref:Oxygen sensor histidine kinase NreB n=1 Tax=Noviherbaspirillum aridicola TaxID=2849687 RepID=A0ABQ4Q9E1_9BURK|nr:CHASE domain-containing protein [Noviherbaspirillum aridicola]GIZ53666.1 hypothetical protein NCCP691_36800 [Noviherbaspirillum aridicola]